MKDIVYSCTGRKTKFIGEGANTILNLIRSVESWGKLVRQMSTFERMLPIRLECQVDMIANLKCAVRAMRVGVLFHPILCAQKVKLHHVDELFAAL